MSVRIRFRHDSQHIADMKAAGRPRWEHIDAAEWDATPAAQPGDCWPVRWHGTNAPAGYDLCCPKCGRVHAWTTALNCASRRPLAAGGVTCDHMGAGSCWTWTGDEATLTASPSLHSVEAKGGCGFHGWLRNGILTP